MGPKVDISELSFVSQAGAQVALRLIAPTFPWQADEKGDNQSVHPSSHWQPVKLRAQLSDCHPPCHGIQVDRGAADA